MRLVFEKLLENTEAQRKIHYSNKSWLSGSSFHNVLYLTLIHYFKINFSLIVEMNLCALLAHKKCVQ